jgi:Leucine-rich repeat (LRR) protein
MTSHVVTLLVLILVPFARPQAVSRIQEDACSVCICSYKATQTPQAVTVDCRNNALLEVPMNIPSDVEVLDLGNNAFIRIMPDDFAGLINLKKLYINNNDIKVLHDGGTSVGVLDTLTELEEIDLSMNLLTGDGLYNTDTHRSVFHSLTKLKVLDISRNQIDKLHPMPAFHCPNTTVWNNCTKEGLIGIEKLKFGTNLFHKQPIPIKSFHNLTTLKELSMEGCHFEKDIPDFSSLVNLTSLDLSLNRLQGVIPESMMTMTALHHLQLNNNQLVQTIPESITQLKQLRSLNLGMNLFNGNLPNVSSMPELTQLYIQGSGNYEQGVCGESLLGCGLGGILPTMKGSFRGFTGGCFLAGNGFDCPLPDGAEAICSASCL